MWRALLSCHGVLNGQQVKNLNGKGASGVRAAVPFQDGDDDGIGWGVVEWSRGDCRDGTGEPAPSRQPIEAAGRNQMGLVKLGPGSWPPWPSDEATNGPSRADASSQPTRRTAQPTIEEPRAYMPTPAGYLSAPPLLAILSFFHKIFSSPSSSI